MVLVEEKHLQGEHDQETHGNRFSHNPVRLLGRGMGALRNPAPRVRRVRPERAGARPAAPSGDTPVRRPSEFGPKDRGLRDRPTAQPVDFADMTDEQLYSIVGSDADPDLKAAVFAELDRRTEWEDAWTGTPEQQEAAEAYAARVAERKPMSKRRRLEQDYLIQQEGAYIRAAEELGIAMLSRAGQKAMDEGRLTTNDLFSGGLRRDLLKKYASEDLLRWFAANPHARMTFTEYLQEHQDTHPDRTPPKRRPKSPLSEFG